MLRLCSQFLAAFVAGFLSLVWQLCALRIGIQEIGGNLSTSAAILSTSLMGLAVGSWFFGKLADKDTLRNRLAAALLLLVGVATILFFAFGRTAAVQFATEFADSSLETPGAGWGPIVYAVLFVFPVHCVIGGIVPALLAQSVSGSVRKTMARLYAAETMGAATGALVTVFQLIPTIGIQMTLLACGLSAAVISLLVFWERRQQFGHSGASRFGAGQGPEEVAEFAAGAQTTDLPGRRWVLCLAVLFSSFASLGIELIWQRYFVFVFGSDSRSYAVIVAVMLLGVSLGSLLAGVRWIRDRTHVVYWLSLFAIGGCISLSFLVLGMSMRIDAIQQFLEWLLLNPFASRFGLAAAVVLVPAIAMGFALPLASELWVKNSKAVGKGIGQFYGLVAIGNVIGIFCCASFLIPQLGLQRTSLLLATLPLAGGLLMAILYRPSNLLGKVVAALATAASIAMLVTVLNNPARAGLVIPEGWNEVFYFEDSVQTIAVIESQEQEGYKKLLIDGVSIGESGGGVDEKQQMLAHLPALLTQKTEPLRVYTIGLGTGILASELAEQDAVQSVVAIELSKGVVRSVDFFAKSNQTLSANPKVQIINDDGIRYLRQSDMEFDAIVSDGKSRPGAASNVSFFSREYYLLCESKLSDEGLFVQWVSIKCADEELATILKTFVGAFPFGHVGIAGPGSVYLVGSKTPLQLQPAKIDAHLSGAVAASLRKYGWGSADDILSMYWLDQKVLETGLSDSANVNSFDTPILERLAWDSFRYSVQSLKPQLPMLQELVHSDESSSFNGQPVASDTPLSKARSVTHEILGANLVVQAAEPNWLDTAASHWKRAMVALPNLNRQKDIASYYRELVQQAVSSGDLSQEYSSLLNLAELNCCSASDQLRIAKILESQGAFDQAVQHHFEAVSAAEVKAPYQIAFAECLMLMRKYRQASRQLNRAMRAAADDQPVLKRARFLLDICEFSSTRDDVLLQSLLRQGSEDLELRKVLQKFQIGF